MKRILMTGLAAVVVALLAVPSVAASGRGNMGGMGGRDGAGRDGMGYGMMGGKGYQAPALDKPLTLDTAAARAASAVTSWGYTDLAVDEVVQYMDGFYVLMKEKASGKAAVELCVNARTGVVTPAHGMGWNSKYNTRAYTGTAQAATVNAAAAEKAVKDWLAAQGATASWTYKTVELPGYFSVRLVRDNRVEDMFQVNAVSGAVSHGGRFGAFIASKDF